MCNLVRSGRPDPATCITTTYEREYCTRQVIENAEAGEPCEIYEFRTDGFLREPRTRAYLVRLAACWLKAAGQGRLGQAARGRLCKRAGTTGRGAPSPRLWTYKQPVTPTTASSSSRRWPNTGQRRQCGQSCRSTFIQVRRKRPKPAVHSLDQMTLHRVDSGRSFQVQQSHGCERRFIACIQTRFHGAVSAYF